MPGLYLPRTPYDLLVYDFPCNFSGIVGGYGLWYMCLRCIRATCDYLFGLSATDRGKTYGDRAEIVWKSCSHRAVSARKSYGARAASIMKTCLYNFDPLKSHFYIVKLGYTRIYIIFLISAQKHRLWVLVRTASSRRF